ncbi:MAG: hypothetical protein WAU91_09965 [Desulfatitalea sp.]
MSLLYICHHGHRRRSGLGVGAVLLLSVLTLGMGSNKAASTASLSLEGLYAYCGLPAPCDAPVTWEGKSAVVGGRLDPLNIFDKTNFPQLPYEKFRLTDGQGRSVEIWAQAKDNRPIFEKLARRTSDEIMVRGRLTAFKMPVAGDCKTGVKVVIDDAEQITFQSK